MAKWWVYKFSREGERERALDFSTLLFPFELWYKMSVLT